MARRENRRDAAGEVCLVRLVTERVFFAILQEFTELGDHQPAVCCECSNQRLHRTQGRHQNCLAIRERLFTKPWLGVVSAVSNGGVGLGGKRRQGPPATALLNTHILAGFQVFSSFNAVIDRHFRLADLGKPAINAFTHLGFGVPIPPYSRIQSSWIEPQC